MGRTELKIEIDSDLLAEAEAAGMSVAVAAERQLRRALSEIERFKGLSDEQKAQKWAEENAEAIKVQSERLKDCGIFGEDLRSW